MSINEDLRDELIQKLQELTGCPVVYEWHSNLMFNLKDAVLGTIILELDPDRKADMIIYSGLNIYADAGTAYLGRCQTIEDCMRYQISLPENSPTGDLTIISQRMPAFADLSFNSRVDYFFLPTAQIFEYVQKNAVLRNGKE
ncbi:MAG: hypothetical protein NDI94_01600 [Candidatus Woesearchaeota archaeon]|nr:hypothetical protein [Candidatus Woesearchaeota archaeon]